MGLGMQKRIVDDLYFLYPLNRSLANDEFDRSCQFLLRNSQYKILSVSSGAQVFDWTVPKRWTLNEGWVKNVQGKIILSSKDNTLHVASYSESVNKVVSREELLAHMNTIPFNPTAIPYRTTYYKQDWQFCAPHNLLESEDFLEPFTVFIDSTLEEGNLNYYEVFLPGAVKEEILVSTYGCHPNLANDNLSGLLTFSLIVEALQKQKNYLSYRLVIVPETIGAIALLSQLKSSSNIIGGFVVTTNAGPGNFGYKQTYLGNHWLDSFAETALMKLVGEFDIFPFAPDGSDERQYSGPGFRFPMITITKSKYHTYPEYHTSQDNLNFLDPNAIEVAKNIYLEIINLIEGNAFPGRNNNQYCEFQLGKKGLYPSTGGGLKTNNKEDLIDETIIDAYGWLMFYSDGRTPLSYIQQKSGIEMNKLSFAYSLLRNAGLLT